MKTKRYFSVWVVLLGVLSLIGCAKDPIAEISTPEEKFQELTKIPYADKSDLEQFSSNKEIVNYSISREMALFDLEDFKKDVYQDKKNLTLSELPVIIYDNDGLPKYYEFIVLDNDKEIGTITSFAKKEVPGFTAYVFPL